MAVLFEVGHSEKKENIYFSNTEVINLAGSHGHISHKGFIQIM